MAGLKSDRDDYANPSLGLAMAKTPMLVSLWSLTNLTLLLNDALVNSDSFSIRLTHPYSPESPLFQSKLSHVQRIKSLVSQSKIRANNLAKTSSSSIIQTQIDVQHFLYVVKLGIGTFKSKPSYKEYYLVMDTGSDLLWMQCKGCINCFEQTPKPFPKDKSSSFRPVLVKNMPSHYEHKYGDGDSTEGILARETFYLRPNDGGIVKIENLEFGCGLKNKVQYRSYKNNKIAGIMGLGWEDLSFVQQISPQINGKFSYCLPLLLSRNTSNTYLRFGDEKIRNKNSKTTPLYRKKEMSMYYLDLQGISVNQTKLNINPKVFKFNKNDSSGGCIIDSGTPYSRIISPAFDLLKLELQNHFSRMKGFKKIKTDLGLELCYGRNKREGLNKLPDVTFHLQGSQAYFVMKAEAVFEVVKGYPALRFREIVCLAMVRSKEMSIIGSHQQTNQKIVHDTKNKKLIFYPEDCSKNP